MHKGGKLIITSETDLKQKDADRELEMTVFKSNDLVQKARHQLTERELKLVDYMVSKIKPDDTKLEAIETSVNQINAVMGFGRGGNNVQSTANALVGLTNKGFWLKLDSGTITTTRWLNRATIEPDGRVTLEFDDVLTPYLIGLKKNYTRYSLGDIVALRGKYAVMLYQLAASWFYVGGVHGTTEEFLEYFGKEGMPWWRFRTDYLRKAIDEVNEKTAIKVHLATGKRGKKVSEVEFSFTAG